MPASTDKSSHKSSNTTAFDLTPKEAALIMLIRHLGQGVLEKVTVKDGQPVSIEKTEQRFMLDNTDTVGRMFEVEGKFYPLGR